MAALAALWAQSDPNNLSNDWINQGAAASQILSSGKVGAATGSTEFVSEAMRQQGVRPEPAGRLVASRFGLLATDGRPIGTALYTPVVRASIAMSRGATPTEAKRSGLGALQMVARTEVADAGRQGVSAAMVADRTVACYFREVGPKACGRCAILAGKVFYTMDGASFLRHPSCQCTAVPGSEKAAREKKNPNGFNPEGYFKSLTSSQQDRLFTKSGAEAIRSGADMNQVVNSRLGMGRLGSGTKWTTTAGTSKRSLYRSVTERGRSGAPRLTTDAIYKVSSTREEAVRRLIDNGYILPS